MFANKAADYSNIEKKMEVMRTLGVPYTDEDIAQARETMKEQAEQIAINLENDPDYVKSYEDSQKRAQAKGEEFVPMSDREIVALIAYLQRLGTDIKERVEE
jgi:cytochrome c oxidase cbb3-type subunit I/II